MKFLYLLICFSVTFAAQAESAPVPTPPQEQAVKALSKPKYHSGYVSDNLKTYLHSGPGPNYRIIGRLSAGEHISISNREKNNFTQITTMKGRSGWLPNQILTSQKTLKYQVNKLQKERDEATSMMQSLQDKLTILQSSQAQNLGDLDQRLALAQSKLRQLQKEYDVAQQGRTAAENALHLLQGNLTSSMWKQGALIAFSGMIFGFFLAFLPRPTRRKKSGSWMN